MTRPDVHALRYLIERQRYHCPAPGCNRPPSTAAGTYYSRGAVELVFCEHHGRSPHSIVDALDAAERKQRARQLFAAVDRLRTRSQR